MTWMNFSKEECDAIWEALLDHSAKLRKKSKFTDANKLVDLANRIQANPVEQSSALYAAYRKTAAEKYNSDGDLEFGDDSIVSKSEDGGAYVMGWKWVDDGEVPICCECGEPYEEGGDGYDGKCPSCADKEEADRIEALRKGWKEAVAKDETDVSFDDWQVIHS